MKKGVLFIFLLSAVINGCGKKEEAVAPKKEEPVEQSAPAANPDRAILAAFGALPPVMESTDNPVTEEKVNLGRQLYFDKRLSKNHDVSCNSCHGLSTFGVDNKAVSEGHKGQKGGRNSPTVYNAAGHFVQFWDGRAPTVEEQAKGPVLNPVEMAMKDEASVIALLKSIPGYVESFGKAFPGEADPVTYNNFGKAIGAFERGLTTPSAFDAYINGDDKALTDAEKAGLKKFVDTGCITCHMGTYVGGAMYQKLGLIIPYPDQSDLGRFDHTKNEADKMFFKVPSLRNVAKTAPYFHNGKVASLDEAVVLMGKHQLGKDLSGDDVASIITFLNTLTGKLPTTYIEEPVLPPSSPTTPAADPN
ncbi:cytochrome-c peroxidase [bacterium]|nr:cytochrome-c peroxidase [bacterium]